MKDQMKDRPAFFLHAAAIIIALAAFLPLLSLLFFAYAQPTTPLWQESRFFLISIYLSESLLMAAGAGALALVAGTAAGWMTALTRFPGRRLLAWLLVLPLALPPYVLAYVYGEFFDRILWLPSIRSLAGASFVLALALYPYVYLAARLAFTREALGAFQAARALGQNSWQSFRRTALPAARPALAAGTALVLMESFNDIGVSEYFGVRSLTAGIYDLWLNRSDLAAAMRTALILLLCAFALIWLERALRGRRRYHTPLARPHRRLALSPASKIACLVFCASLPLLGFFLPVVLLAMAFIELPQPVAGLAAPLTGSLLLAAPAALITSAAALLLAYFVRLHRDYGSARLAARLAVMGYAMPGAVLALAIIAPLALWNQAVPTSLAIAGTAPLLFAYFVRFLILPYGMAEAALSRIRPSIDGAAQLLGAGTGRRLMRIHLPLLRPALMAGLLLVFVEVMRELPATLLLRPFNFETLATRLYDYASLGLFEQSAQPALLLAMLGLAPALIWHQLRRPAHR